MNKLSVSDLAIIQLLSMKPLYGLEIIEQLREFNISTSFGSIYQILKRLNDAELIEAVTVKSNTRNAHRKTHYTATQKGKDVFQNTIKLLNQLQENTQLNKEVVVKGEVIYMNNYLK